MSVEQAEFRQVMGHFATGVTIITTHDGRGQLFGLTANAVCSVSLEPPLVLVCVDKVAESYPALSSSGCFTINLLAESQEALSRRFAKSGGDKFSGVGYRICDNGAAVLDDVIAHLACAVRHRFEAGDHTIFVGEVTQLAVSSEENPLLFFRGGYRNLSA
jgi:flavin reductase (DIM6/NTAB) family NADH-FMN oxidoreductase RutF